MATSSYAFVTLLTSDSYLPGALALAAALKDLHPSPPSPPQVPFVTACLVTPESVDVSSVKLLRSAFDLVVGVELITQQDQVGLKLLGEHLRRVSLVMSSLEADSYSRQTRPQLCPYKIARFPTHTILKNHIS